MTNIHTWEVDGFFNLTYSPSYRCSDDLGRGSETTAMRFRSEEGRSLFISLSQQIEQLNKLCDNQASQIRYLKTVKGANANLREVRKANPK